MGRGGGVNDALALTEQERKFLERHIENLFDARESSGRELTGSDQMVLRMYQHIGVLDNRIANFGAQYRANEKAGEGYMETVQRVVDMANRLEQAVKVAEGGHVLVGEATALRATHNDLIRALKGDD
jgi:chromosome segregation ATPase